MTKGGSRTGTVSIFLIGAIVLALLLIYLILSGKLNLSGKSKMALPVDLKAIIPTAWTPLAKEYKACDFDGDGETEWLVVYRYDKSKALADGLIGAVVYDAQANRVPQESGTPSPYRPAFIVPYKLLPDIYTGKGQGYLGESGVEVSYYPAKQDEKSCQAAEIVVRGFSGDSKAATRLSIFHWKGRDVGYPGVHFVGNARVETGPSEAPGLITRVTTYNRLNDRSLLCEVRGYTLPVLDQDGGRAMQPTEDTGRYTMDFCFEAPADPAYPEGVVVALLRGESPDNTTENPSPTDNSFLTTAARNSLPPELDQLKNAGPTTALRILSVTTPGTIELHAGNGWLCRENIELSPTQADTRWWCGREEAHVTTEVMLDSGTNPRQIIWTLISLANESISADVHWRITSVDLR